MLASHQRKSTVVKSDAVNASNTPTWPVHIDCPSPITCPKNCIKVRKKNHTLLACIHILENAHPLELEKRPENQKYQ